MLTITIKAGEVFDEVNSRIIEIEDTKIVLEHSLLSLTKWEEKWHKPFIGNKDLSEEMILDYIKCMTITQNVNPLVYDFLSVENIEEIKKYIADPMTATWFGDGSQNGVKGMHTEIVTAEVIYSWMIACGIPFECQKWHINKLTTLIRVCSEKNNPDKKKMSVKQTMMQNDQLNKMRRAQMNSKG